MQDPIKCKIITATSNHELVDEWKYSVVDKKLAHIVWADLSGNNIKVSYFPIQKELKILPKRSSEVKRPVISDSANWHMRNSSASSSPAR